MARTVKSWQKAVVLGTTISSSLAGLVGGGYFLGQYLDAYWGTHPWLTIILMLIGLVMGAFYLVITIQKFGASDDKR